MACKNSDLEESSDSDNGLNKDGKKKSKRGKQMDPAKKVQIVMNKIRRKQMLRTHWLETRELKRKERQERLARGEEEEAEEEDEPKEELVQRIPGKRGRPRRKRRHRRRRVDANPSDKEETNLFAQSFYDKDTPRLEVLAGSQNLVRSVPSLGAKVRSPQ